MVMHITATCSKAKQILGLNYRHFYGSAGPDTLKQLYLSIWFSHTLTTHARSGTLTLLKTKKFCRLASHQWDSSYQDLFQLYQLPSLEEHRLHLKLVQDCYYPDIPSFCDNIHRRAAHAFQFRLPFAHTNVYYFSYFPHTMSVWNSLDSECVAFSTYSSIYESS